MLYLSHFMVYDKIITNETKCTEIGTKYKNLVVINSLV